MDVWLKETYPDLAARAKAEGAVICFGDETTMREDTPEKIIVVVDNLRVHKASL